MNRISILLVSLFFITELSFTQSVGIGTVTPDQSALLEVTSVTKGFLMPRMTAAQRQAIQLPAPGLQVFQYDGTKGIY